MKNSSFTLTSLNLNGIRSAASKGLEAWVAAKRPDCMCVQEVKAQADDVVGKFDVLAGMRGSFQYALKKGYSGVGIYTRHEPSDVVIGFEHETAFGRGEFNDEGRLVELRFDRPGVKFSVLSAYFPSGSSGEDRQAAKFRFLAAIEPHLQQLAAEREFILCGDINIAHQEQDLKNWKSNQKNSGFTPEERAWVSKLFASGSVVDVYRRLHPDTTDDCYTWWSQRGQAWANNVGWRLDYHWATPQTAAFAKRCEIEKAQRFSDHAPITIEYAMP
jgi:exodeoxyribonuclease III